MSGYGAGQTEAGETVRPEPLQCCTLNWPAARVTAFIWPWSRYRWCGGEEALWGAGTHKGAPWSVCAQGVDHMVVVPRLVLHDCAWADSDLLLSSLLSSWPRTVPSVTWPLSPPQLPASIPAAWSCSDTSFLQ